MKFILHRSLLFLTLAVKLTAQETLIREVYDVATDTHVEVLGLFSKPSISGYFPVRVKISNQLKGERSVQLSFDSSSSYSSGNHCASSFNFTAAGGKTLTQDILVPLCPPSYGSSYGNSLKVKLSGSLGSAEGSSNSEGDHSKPQVLLSQALFTVNASSLDAALSPSSSYGGSAKFAVQFDPKQFPDNWLALAGYDSVLMTDLDWLTLPASGRNAILSWLRLGGQLAIFNSSAIPLKTLGIPSDASFGSVEVKTISSDLKLDPKATIELVEHTNPNHPRVSSLTADFAGAWPLQNHFGAQTFRYALFIIVLILFAALVGPINLFVFAKSGQRHRLFITTPLISLAASLLLVVLIIAQDGFGGSGMRRVLMEVRPDGDQNSAFIQQEQFCRTGVLTSSRFSLAEPCAFSPVAIASSRWARFTDSSESDGNFNLQLEGSKLAASGDWFQSRSEHGHTLSAVVSTRGRIERTETPDALLSTFDFPIKTLYYCSPKGEWFRANSIVTGKRFNLTAVDLNIIKTELEAEIDAFAPRNQEILRRIYQRSGCFIALTADRPGIDTLPGIRWKETQTVITGPVVAP